MKVFSSYEELQAHMAMEEEHDEYVRTHGNWRNRDLAEYYGYQDDDEYGYEQFLDDM